MNHTTPAHQLPGSDDEVRMKILAVLKQAQQRPGMFFPVTKDGVLGFLGALHIVYHSIFALPFNEIVSEQVFTERGWDPNNSMSIWPMVEEQGWPIERAIQEVLTIEIEIVSRILGIH